jgi:hypothetical protein
MAAGSAAAVPHPPHGFCVLSLHRTEREEWRFHVWPQGMRLISGMPGPIHTHDKVVDSRVLKGELTNVVYSVAEAPTGGLPVYEVEYPSDKYDPRATNLLKRASARVAASVVDLRLVLVGEPMCFIRRSCRKASAPAPSSACIHQRRVPSKSLASTAIQR